MLHIIKQEINMSKELLSKIEWTCKMKKVKPKIINGTLRIVEHTNLAYVEPHRVIIKDKMYLFFNEQDYFYIDSLENKYPLSKFNENIVQQAKTLIFQSFQKLYYIDLLIVFKNRKIEIVKTINKNFKVSIARENMLCGTFFSAFLIH